MKMNYIFEKIGLIKSSNQTEKIQHLKYYYISNNDKSPRWIWSTNLKSPDFLKFYYSNSFKSKIYVAAIKYIFLFRIQHILFKKNEYIFDTFDLQFFDIKSPFSLFTGTIGPNNKYILYQNSNFYKIANSENSRKLINDEYNNLSKISLSNLPINIPKATMLSPNILKTNEILNSRKNFSINNNLIFNQMLELMKIDRKNYTKNNFSGFKTLENILNELKSESKIPIHIKQKLNLIYENIEVLDEIKTSFAHTDFTPWNLIANQNSITLIDLELATSEMPILFDYFHYFFQDGILVQRKNWSKIKIDLESNLDFFIKNEIINDKVEMYKYLKYYLLYHVTNSLKLYSLQEKWHEQIYWMIDTWNEALNEFVFNFFSRKKLFIMDFLDHMYHREYGILKGMEGNITEVSEFSDIDILIGKDTYKNSMKFIENYVTKENIQKVEYSFMSTSVLNFTDGEFLFLDFIFNFKWKNLIMFDYKNSSKNWYLKSNFDYNKVDDNIEADFITLFYTLNDSKIPDKYFDKCKLHTSSHFENKNKSKLIEEIKANRLNKNINYIKNSFLYFMDKLKELIFRKGFVITLSGVDGAGKTTILTNLTYILEKKHRKQVVHLRHRPSLLPILSVWSKGKEEAHLSTINSLPRQGNNKNKLSSVLRFSYYYFDYFVGHIFIYFKYLIRGKVVIYDRYYFDFINDSKRSNIIISKKLTTFLYNFIYKPKFNFFLYASPQTILSRKQEMDETTILQLTNDYKSTFNLFSQKYKQKYICINNENLNDTLNIITKNIF